MKDIKVQSPNGDIYMVSQRAFDVIYKPLYGYKIYEENPLKKARKAKEVNKNDSKHSKKATTDKEQ